MSRSVFATTLCYFDCAILTGIEILHLTSQKISQENTACYNVSKHDINMPKVSLKINFNVNSL